MLGLIYLTGHIIWLIMTNKNFRIEIYYTSHPFDYSRAELNENVSSGICEQRRPRSACASAQSDQGLHCPLTESLDIAEYMNGDQGPDETLRMRRMNLNLCVFRLFVDTFCLA